MALKRLSFFTASNYLSLLFSFMQSIMLARILNQYQMGYFSQVRLFLSYILLLNAGSMNGLITMLPNLGNDDRIMAKNTNLTLSFIQFSAISAVCIILFAAGRNTLFAVLAVLAVPYACREALSFAFRGEGRFKEAALFNTVFAFSSLIVTVSLAYFFKLRGAVSGVFLSVALSAAYGIFLSPKTRFSLSMKIVRRLYAEGFRIYLNGLLNMLSDSFERLLLAFIIARESFAVYAVAVAMVSVFDMLPSSIGQFLLPDFVGNPKRWDSRRVRVFINFNVFITSVFIIISSSAYYVLIRYFLPLYTRSLTLFSIMAVSSFFSIVYYAVFNKMVSAGKMRVMYYSQAAIIFFKIILLGVYFRFSESVSLETVAFMMLGVKIVYALVLAGAASAFTGLRVFSASSAFHFAAGFAAAALSMALLRSSPIYGIAVCIVYAAIYSKRFIAWKRELI